jgi:hypothetical protein
MTNEMPSSPMSALRLMPSKLSEVAKFVRGIVDSVKNGEANPLEVLVMLKSFNLASEEIIEQIQDNISNEADKYSEKKFNAYGAIVEKADVGVKYKYETAKDPEWERLDTDAKTAKIRLSERETFLKALKEPMTLVNKDTGEVYDIRPPFKTGKPGVKVYIK